MRAVLNKLYLIVFMGALSLVGQGLRYEPPKIPGYEPPFESSFSSPLSESNPRILVVNSDLFTDTTAIDFEKRQLTFLRQDSLGNTVWTYHYGELSDYISDSRGYSFYNSWYSKLSDEARKNLGIRQQTPKLQWELAVHYPPWAQRLLGKDPPRLKIEGRLEITLSSEYTSYTIGTDKQTNFSPIEFENNYEFTIRGSVGRLISVNISHSKQEGFDLSDDPLKNFKVEYRESEPGELEDEIIQEIIAGYTGFDMPGTSLSGYSDKADGLFGIKVRAKVGPLMLTTIASHSQGEAFTRELGGKDDPYSTNTLKTSDFVKNRYFFLDNEYKEYYNKVYNINDPDRNAKSPPKVKELQVFISVPAPELEQNNTIPIYCTREDGYFKLLTKDQDYTFDSERGWVRITHNVYDGEAIAITMTVDNASSSLNKGTFVPPNTLYKDTVNLWILKPRSMDDASSASEPNFGLMWRNVYEYYGADDAKFDLFYLDPSRGDTIKHVKNQRLISYVLGLTDSMGRARLEVVDIFNIENNELILPPWDPGINGNEPFANPRLIGNDDTFIGDTLIYRYGTRSSDNAMKNYVPKFNILTSGTVRRTSYDNLGWNIIEGTVKVRTKSGTELIEGEDYLLDYQMGILDLISTRARAAESILITYQRESDFVLDRKVFAGLRGEVRLPFISDNSFAAMSLLYQSASTSAGDVPNLGNEPYSKLHLSFNTSLDFQPEWMTRAVNYIPFIKTDQESSAKIDFEIVQSHMNTNTSKGSNAYLDDFDQTKDYYALSLRHQSWHPSHYPFKYDLDSLSAALLKTPPAWDFYWFTPVDNDVQHRVFKSDVWKGDKNSRYDNTGKFMDVLRLHATPAHPELRDRFKKSYASITTSFGRNGLNMENHRFLEILVKPDSGKGTKGKLNIQIGTFRHDQVRDGGPPNGSLAVEDPTYQNKPEQLSKYDTGLNGLPVDEKFYVVPNAGANAWDTISRYQNTNWLVFPRSLNDPSGDLFRKYDNDNTGNFRFVNGTRGNNQFDNENIDADGIPRVNPSFQEKYFSYEIDLDKHSAYIDTNTRLVENKGWVLYRIPLKEILDESGSITKDTVGNLTSWTKMRGLRLVWHGFDTTKIGNRDALTEESKLLIAGIELVGNYWEVVPTADGSEPKIEATNISNLEDSVYYSSVYGRFVKPKSNEQTPKEESLRLRFHDLVAGDVALVRKNMHFNPQNISGYDSVSIELYGDRRYNDDVKFVFRFGSDDSTFYEYRGPINPGWGNRIAISLQELSDLKLAADIDNKPIDTLNASGRLRIHAPVGKRPNFNNITFMALGVMRDVDAGIDPINGEIWINELTVTGARKLTGVAARVNLSTQWADFLSLSAAMTYTDGNFRTMTEALIGEDRSELSANVNARVRMDKFLPDDWGVSLPVGGSVSGALSRPAVKPQSDILLLKDNGKPDGFFDMAGDALDKVLGKDNHGEHSTRAQRFETFSTTQTLYSSFEKTSQSDNPFIGMTFDRTKLDVSYNMTASYAGKGPHENPDSADYFRTDSTYTYTGNLRYDLSPRNPPSWTSVTPFSEAAWMPGIYKEYEFNLLPSTMTFDLAEILHRTERRNDPKLNVHNFETYTFDLRHGMRAEYSPISPLLNLSYGLRLDRDISDHKLRGDWDYIMDSTVTRIFGLNNRYGHKWNEYGILHGERSRTQSAGLRLSPQFFSWLTHSIDYSADYSGQLVRRDNDSIQYMNAAVSTSLRLRNSLMVNDLFKGLSEQPLGGDLFSILRDGTNKIGMRSVSMDYSASTELKNSFLSSTFLADSANMSNYEFFKYQLGMRRGFGDYVWGRTGDAGLGNMFYREKMGVNHSLYRFDQSSGSWAVSYSTAFHIPDPLKINFSNVSVGWGREFWAQPDTTYIDTSVVFPEIRVSANTEILSKLSFVSKHFSKLSANSSFSYKLSRKELRDRTDTTGSVDFQPLIGLEGRFLKWPTLSVNYRYGTGTTTIIGVDKESGDELSREQNTRNSHTVNAAYEISNTSRLQEIKLWKWVIPVQGKTNMGLTINHEKNVRIIQITGGDRVTTTNTDLNYSPFIEYRFTDNIRGQFRYVGTHKNQDGAKTMQQRFALTAEVVF